MANGLLSDWMSGTGVYGSPNAIDPSTGVPYADVRSAQLGALGNIGSLLIAAGQPMTGAQRAQLLGQIGPQLSGMQTDIYNAAQRRLMQAQFQDQMAARASRTALAEEAKADPLAFEKKYGFNPTGLSADMMQSLIQKQTETNILNAPQRKVWESVQKVLGEPSASPTDALAAEGKGPTVAAGRLMEPDKYKTYMRAAEVAAAQGPAGLEVAKQLTNIAEMYKPQKGEIFGSAEGGYYRAIPGQETVQIVPPSKKDVKPQIFGNKDTGYHALDENGNIQELIAPQTKGFSPEVASTAHTLRSEMLNQDAVKTFTVAQKNAGTLKELVQRANSGEAGVATGANDIAIVYNFFTTLDPKSVVREAEFESLGRKAGLPATIISQLQQVSGGGFLPPETRAELVRIANSYLDRHYQDVKNLSDTYQGFASQLNIDPKLVTIDLRSPEFKKRQEEENTQTQATNQIKAQQQQSDPIIAQINNMTVSDVLSVPETQKQSWNEEQKRAFLERLRILNKGK